MFPYKMPSPSLPPQIRRMQQGWNNEDTGLEKPEKPEDPLKGILPEPPKTPEYMQQFLKPPPQEPSFTPEEEHSLLGGMMGGVEYLGESLDKPFAALRGLLGGEPSALFNLIPFADTIADATGLPRPPRVSGRDLLEKAGAVDKEGRIFGSDWGLGQWPANILGFGTELALNPFWGLKLGPLTAKGLTAMKAAQDAAAVAKTGPAQAAQYIADVAKGGSTPITQAKTAVSLANQIRSGERAVVGFRPLLPFMPEIQLGAESKMAPALLEAAAYNPVSRAVRGVFSHVKGVGGHYGEAEQMLADQRYLRSMQMMGALEDTTPAFRQAHADLFDEFQKIADHFQANGDQAAFNRFTRAMAELPNGVAKGQDLLDEMTKRLGLGTGVNIGSAGVADPAALAGKFHEFIDSMKQTQDTVYDYYRSLGGSGKLLEDPFAEHFYRGANAAAKGSKKLDYARGEGLVRAWLHRDSLWANVPGGTEMVNNLVQDPYITGRWIDKASSAAVNAAPGGIAPGVVVKAADRSNFGRVVSIAGDKAKVMFRNPDDGAIATVELPLKQLEATAATGTAPPITRAIDPKENAQYLRGMLDPANPILANPRAGLNDLRAAYIQEQMREQASAMLARGEITQDAFDAAFDPVNGSWMYSGKRQAAWTTQKKEVANQARRMAARIANLSPEIQDTGLYNKSLIEDWAAYMRSLMAGSANLETIHSFLQQPGVVNVGGAAGQSLAAVWKKAGLDPAGMRTAAAAIFPNQQIDAKFIKSLSVSNEAASAIGAMTELTKPAAVGKLSKLWDDLTSYYKYWWTIPWPSFHVRNRIGGMYNALIDGKVNLAELWDGGKAVRLHIQSGGEKSAEFLQEAIDNGVFRGLGSMAESLGPEKAARLSNVPQGLLGGSLDFLASPVESAKHPFKTLSDAGNNAYNYVETLNRGGYYEALRKKGFTPSEAKYLVTKTQFDYSLRSPFERDIGSRLYPFLGWIRNNLPYQLATIATNPTGVAATTARAYNTLAASDQEYAPSFLKEGASMLIGGTPQATTYLRQSGLPIEDLNRFVFNAHGVPVTRTAEKFAAGLNPGILFPLEMYGSRQLWTGRDIKDLESPSEQIQKAMGATSASPYPFLDRLIHYTPLANPVSNAMTLIDDRKNWLQRASNLLAGPKFATYDTEKWKAIDLSDALKKQLQALPTVRTMEIPYVPQRYQELPSTAPIKQDIQKTEKLAKYIAMLKKRQAEQASQ